MNVGTPRIYVDLLSFAKAMDILDGTTYNGGIENYFDIEGNKSDFDLIGLNPSNICQLKQDSGGTDIDGTDRIIFHSKINWNELLADNVFHAVLGHNFASTQTNYFVESASSWLANEDSGVNWENNAELGSTISYDGFSLAYAQDGSSASGKKVQFEIRDRSSGELYSAGYPNIGSLVFGNYYDFPHSPDLNLTMTIENDGITTQQTKGGATLTNARYSGAPKWGDLGCWELQSSPPNYWNFNANLGARAGRRSLNLTFSYLSDKHTLPINALGSAVANNEDGSNANGYIQDDLDDSTFEIPDWWWSDSVGGIFGAQYSPLNVLNGEDFFSSVWNKTMGGHLPFIFQPNKDNANPDQFAICRFDMNSLQVKQVAYNTYTISLKIRECW